MLKTVIFSLQMGLTSNFVPDYQTVKLCSKVAKIRVWKSFLAVIDTKRVSEIYESYFANCHVTV